jgi:hypothetical protein
MDIWRRLEQEPDSPEVYEAALQRLFSEGQLYRALADAALPLERLRCALSPLKDYLRYYGGSVDPYRTFACHCPLCRGTHGEHHLRVLELAESVAWAWRFSVVNDLPVEARLHQAEEHLYRAVQRLCPDAAPIRAVSWSSEHPLRDLLHQYAARYPDPALSLSRVGGYHQKTLPFDRYRALCLIVPSGDYALAQSRLPDWRSRLLPAVDIDQALQQATQLPAAVQQLPAAAHR